jgi:hypothetical protein
MHMAAKGKGAVSPGKGGKVKTVVSGNPKVVKAAKQSGGTGGGSDKSPYSSARASLKGGRK